jgi:hypothetical protein
VHVWDVGDTHYRGGVVTGVGASVTIRFLAEQFLVKTANVAPAVAGTRAVGQPVCVQVTGVEQNAHTIVAVLDSHWANSGPGSDEAGAVQRGQFHYGVVPRHLTGEREEYDWTHVA